MYQIKTQTELYTIYVQADIETATDVLYEEIDYHISNWTGSIVDGTWGHDYIKLHMDVIINQVKTELLTGVKIVKKEVLLDDNNLLYRDIRDINTLYFHPQGITYSKKINGFKKYVVRNSKKVVSVKGYIQQLRLRYINSIQRYVRTEYELDIRVMCINSIKVQQGMVRLSNKLGYTFDNIMEDKYGEGSINEFGQRLIPNDLYQQTLTEFSNWYLKIINSN